jgi:hypothetical protein
VSCRASRSTRRPDETRVKEPPGNKPPPEKDPPSKKRPVKEPERIAAASLREEPQFDELERFLVLLFLRYVPYCARRARFAQMNGAADLLTCVSPPSRFTSPQGQ